MPKNFFIYCLLAIAVCSCNSNAKKEVATSSNQIEFKDLKGIVFNEVRREFKNGLSFNEIGFQQEPEWTLTFQANDSVDVFSPLLNKMVGFYLHHDHDNYYNFAREWFAVKLLSKDSIILQRLEVQNLHVENDVRSNVYMLFYSDDFISKNLKTTVAQLRKPSKKDSAYVERKATEANLHPLDSNYFFAARNPVVFTSKSEAASVEKRKPGDKNMVQSKSYGYIYPEYDIHIKNAYKDFYYVWAVVQANGNITVYDFPTFDEETKVSRKKLLQEIINIYIKNLLSVKLGNTLGFSHASLITLYVKGTSG